MKLTEQTKKILENYATINDSIIIQKPKEGIAKTSLQICDKHKMIVAQTLIPEVFDHDICLHDLKAFLSTISVLEDPDITFASDHLIITHGTTKVRLVYGDPATITQIKNTVVLPEAKLSFTLKEELLSKLLNLSGILNLPDLKLFSENGILFFQVLDRKNPSSNTGAIEVGKGSIGEPVFFQRELLKMIPGDYTVDISETASCFKSLKHDNLEYIIALAI